MVYQHCSPVKRLPVLPALPVVVAAMVMLVARHGSRETAGKVTASQSLGLHERCDEWPDDALSLPVGPASIRACPILQ